QCTVQRAIAVPTESVPEHPDIRALIQRYLETSRYYLSKTVAHLDTSLPAHPDQESALVNLLAAEIRQWTEADISLVNAGQLLHSLAEGEVTLEMLHRICPSPINPCRQKLTGLQILVALEESLLSEFRQKAIKGFGFRGEVLGMLGIDGMEVYYDPSQPPYQRIQEVIVSGHPLQHEKLYMVGTLDMFTFGVGYMTLKEGTERKYYLPEFIRDLLGTALQQKDLIASSFHARWHVTQH
ncbi:5'-nucleotidase, partial [Neobacillus drentensis]|uniref:5'-nucleotidase n=1 Tax=Neobacillus drentensis TaxID=220684 RepID=UPI003001C6BD